MTTVALSRSGSRQWTASDRDELDAAISEDEVVELALALGNIDSPPGQEQAASDYVYEWMAREGFDPRRLGLFEHRANVVGRLSGSGDGYSLLFNSHLDTSIAADEYSITRHASDPIYHSAWREGEYLHGNGVCNDKGQMACWLVACRALKRSGISLAGDLVLMAACGEIEVEAIDEYRAPTYSSRDCGTRYAVGKGAVADYAIVAEATDFSVGWVEAGSLFAKLTVFGAEPPIYTPFVYSRGTSSSNAIVRLTELILRIEQWAPKYQELHRYEGEGGCVLPTVNIGAVRGGAPYKLTRTAQQASLYVDMRLAPDQSPMSAMRELRQVVGGCSFETEVELFGYRRGYESVGVEPLVSAVSAVHKRQFGGELRRPEPAITSMWRDLNPLSEAGIPCVMYGPGPSVGHGDFAIKVADLLAASKAYALIAAELCGSERAMV